MSRRAVTRERALDALVVELVERLTPRLADLMPRHADAVAEMVVERLLQHVDRGAHWLDTRRAADHLGMTANALDKLCAARSVPFEQDTPGGKRWFHADDLDAWRRGNNGNAR
jgi:hypothetical protein